MKKNKILLRVPNWIGDCVMVLPALKLLRSEFKDSHISVLVKPWCAGIFESSPFVDEVIIYDAKGRHGGFLGILKLVKELKEQKFDSAVLFQNAIEAAIITWLAKIPIRIGYNKDLRGPLLTNPLKIEKSIKEVHHIFYYLNLANFLISNKKYDINKCDGNVPVPEIVLTEEEISWAKNFIKESSLEDKLIMTLSPGASYGPSKMWPKEYFAEVVNIYSDSVKSDAVAFVIGGPGDKEIGEEISEIGNGKIINVAGELTLRQSMALIKLSNVFVSNDSGPMHIGAALGTLTIGIFGSTEPKWTGPIGEKTGLVKIDIDCSPCFERTCKFGHYDCLRKITPLMVVEKINEKQRS